MNIPYKIKDAISKNNLVVFVGSGLSINFNLPDWKKLVIDVINEIDKQDYNVFIPVLGIGSMKPIEVLEKLKPEHNTVRKYIKNNFNVKSLDLSLHKKIIELTGQIVTTNYDNAFEEASNNSIIPTNYTSNFNISEINKTDDKYIFKLHGSFLEPDNCVIFKEDYDKLYNENSAAIEKLKSIFAEKTILFLGFSFNDSEINSIFNRLDNIFSNNHKHFILTKDSEQFVKFNFLESIIINDYSEIDLFINDCLKIKVQSDFIINDFYEPISNEENKKIKIAFLYPNPLDIDLKDDLTKIVSCFDSLEIELFIGTLNVRTLLTIEDYDALIIVTKQFKSSLYIEGDNLKSDLISPYEICLNIPNDNIPIIFITNEKIEEINNYKTINISTFKNSIINRFIYKAFKEGNLEFNNEEISINLKELFPKKVLKGITKINSIYGNNKNLEIGKKSLTNIIGRIEEQSSIAMKLLNIKKTNKLLNIKASGGTGKTTLIKKVSYELYNRGYFKNGVIFKSCESVRTFEDFEEILIDGFSLNNILNFKEYLIDNYSTNKIDLLIILDNFETVVNVLSEYDFKNVIELLKFATDFANIVVTSREKISDSDEFEDVFSLTPLITDDSLKLFIQNYGEVNNEEEVRILRNEILEDLLNNNPLAIKLVTKSRTRYNHINELKEQLKEHFFESINEDYSLVFKNSADLNIERTKSIYQSINYSYTTLNNKEKIAFELLSLFPDGISLSNFKKCFEKSSSSNNLSDKELRILRDKSLIEDYNGIIQLQPIIRRFAEFQFNKRSKEIKQKFCLDAYLFNCFILDIIEFIEKKNSRSDALKTYNTYKNNLLNVLTYIKDIEINERGLVSEKQYLLNYIYTLNFLIVNEKQINEFKYKLKQLKPFFSELKHANNFIKVINLNKTYYHNEFDESYRKLKKILSVNEMENRILSNEDYIEKLLNNTISNIHSMEGNTIQKINYLIKNDDVSTFQESHFFYLGIENSLTSKKDGFYYFEFEHMFNRLDVKNLEDYIDSLYLEEHLEIMQTTYTLSKYKKLEKNTIQKLVVTNPYTKGLKELMYAFNVIEYHEKINHFEEALNNLSHIKYYYLEALYYYCLFLKDTNYVEYRIKLSEGLELSKKFYYQYLNFLFVNIEAETKTEYKFNYNFYPINTLENFVKRHNDFWTKKLRENKYLN